MTHAERVLIMLPHEPMLLGPDDEVITLGDEDIIDDEDDGPSSLDHEALTDDAC